MANESLPERPEVSQRFHRSRTGEKIGLRAGFRERAININFMAYPTWSPLWGGIVESFLWDESDCIVKIFITMLALKDSDNIVRLTAYGLAKKSGKSEQEVLDALKVLSSPDKRRIEHQEFEGRRIEAVEEGWLILNGEKYRVKVQEEMKRARNRRAQSAFRQRQKESSQFYARNPGLPGEARAMKAHHNGDDAAFNQTVTDHLPEQCQEQPVPYAVKPEPTDIPEYT